MKKILKYCGIIFAVVLLFFGFLFMKQKNEIDRLQFSTIDLSQIEDGTYYGEEKTTLVKAAVEVSIKDHEIQNITIKKHDNGLGQKAEKIVATMIKKNTYEVDAISGATISSQVIKGAVNDALFRRQLIKS